MARLLLLLFFCYMFFPVSLAVGCAAGMPVLADCSIEKEYTQAELDHSFTLSSADELLNRHVPSKRLKKFNGKRRIPSRQATGFRAAVTLSRVQQALARYRKPVQNGIFLLALYSIFIL